MSPNQMMHQMDEMNRRSEDTSSVEISSYDHDTYCKSEWKCNCARKPDILSDFVLLPILFYNFTGQHQS